MSKLVQKRLDEVNDLLKTNMCVEQNGRYYTLYSDSKRGHKLNSVITRIEIIEILNTIIEMHRSLLIQVN